MRTRRRSYKANGFDRTFKSYVDTVYTLQKSIRNTFNLLAMYGRGGSARGHLSEAHASLAQAEKSLRAAYKIAKKDPKLM